MFAAPNPVSFGEMNRTMQLALGSVVVALLVLGLKFLAYRMTGSLALYSDALESIINVVAALAVLVALQIAARPADDNHPYGHSKAEYFSAVAEGVLIVFAAVTILREAVPALWQPNLVAAPVGGLLVNLGASALNAVWAALLLRQGRTLGSPALLADARHVLSDVVTSVGVLIGVGLARVTGWHVLDPLLAALVALNILWSGWHLVRESVGGLMDVADPETTRRLREIVGLNAGGALEIHDLRARQAGQLTFVEFHLVVPGDMSVSEAHLICDQLEDAIRSEQPGAQVTIHVEPPEKAKHHGVPVL